MYIHVCIYIYIYTCISLSLSIYIYMYRPHLFDVFFVVSRIAILCHILRHF